MGAYGALAPYRRNDVDDTATAAHYMLFLQLFVAILIREGLLENIMPPAVISAMLVLSNVFVVVREAVAKCASKLLHYLHCGGGLRSDPVENTFNMPPALRKNSKMAKSATGMAKSATGEDAITRLREKKLGFVPQHDREMVEELLLHKVAPQGIKTTFTLQEDYAFEIPTAEDTTKPTTVGECTRIDGEGSKETTEISNELAGDAFGDVAATVAAEQSVDVQNAKETTEIRILDINGLLCSYGDGDVPDSRI